MGIETKIDLIAKVLLSEMPNPTKSFGQAISNHVIATNIAAKIVKALYDVE